MGRRPSSDWCLVITGKWLSHWPLAKVPVEGNREAEGPSPVSRGFGRAHVWCCKKWGSRTDRADFTRWRLFLLSLGGVSMLMARSYFPEPVRGQGGISRGQPDDKSMNLWPPWASLSSRREPAGQGKLTPGRLVRLPRQTLIQRCQ